MLSYSTFLKNSSVIYYNKIVHRHSTLSIMLIKNIQLREIVLFDSCWLFVINSGTGGYGYVDILDVGYSIIKSLRSSCYS